MKYVLPAVVALAFVTTAFATNIVQALNPGDTFDHSCSTSIVNVSNTGTRITGACATPVPAATPVPTATPVPSRIWIRPQFAQLAKSVGYDQYQNLYGWGTEPWVPAVQQCGYIAHGDDDDKIFWTLHPPAPLTIYGVRFHTWQGSADQNGLPYREFFHFRDTTDTTPTTETFHESDLPEPIVISMDFPVPGLTDYVAQAILPSPVTMANVRVDAESDYSWVTIGDFEILTTPGTAGQASCG